MLGEEDLPLLAKWDRYARKYPHSPDDFVLDFLTKALDYSIATVPLEFYDRSKPALVVRGQWQNEATVVQHATINRWPNPIKYRRAFVGSQRDKRRAESVSRQRKHIFFRNFGGDFERVFQIMESGLTDPQSYSGWVFDSTDWTYAPEFYWPTIKDDFNVKPLTFEKSLSHFNDPLNVNRHRDVAIGRMKLDREDGGKRGLFSMLRNWNS